MNIIEGNTNPDKTNFTIQINLTICRLNHFFVFHDAIDFSANRYGPTKQSIHGLFLNQT